MPVGGGGARASTRAPSPARLEAAAWPAGPGRASRRRAERSSQRGRRAGGQATRRPEIRRGYKEIRRGYKEIRRGYKQRDNRRQA